jgi:hypothetical protein
METRNYRFKLRDTKPMTPFGREGEVRATGTVVISGLDAMDLQRKFREGHIGELILVDTDGNERARYKVYRSCIDVSHGFSGDGGISTEMTIPFERLEFSLKDTP